MGTTKWLLIFGLCIISIIGCPAPDQGATVTVIAENSSGTGNMSFFWGINDGPNKIEWGQGFQVSSATTCSAVELSLGTRIGAPGGDYTIRIETNNVNQPSGTLVDPLATHTVSASSLTDDAWNTWTFSASFNLAAATTYWIVCRTTEPVVADNYLKLKGDGIVTYPSGDNALYIDDAYITSYNDQDIYFRVYK